MNSFFSAFQVHLLVTTKTLPHQKWHIFSILILHFLFPVFILLSLPPPCSVFCHPSPLSSSHATYYIAVTRLPSLPLPRLTLHYHEINQRAPRTCFCTSAATRAATRPPLHQLRPGPTSYKARTASSLHLARAAPRCRPASHLVPLTSCQLPTANRRPGGSQAPSTQPSETSPRPIQAPRQAEAFRRMLVPRST